MEDLAGTTNSPLLENNEKADVYYKNDDDNSNNGDESIAITSDDMDDVQHVQPGRQQRRPTLIEQVAVDLAEKVKDVLSPSPTPSPLSAIKEEFLDAEEKKLKDKKFLNKRNPFFEKRLKARTTTHQCCEIFINVDQIGPMLNNKDSGDPHPNPKISGGGGDGNQLLLQQVKSFNSENRIREVFECIQEEVKESASEPTLRETSKDEWEVVLEINMYPIEIRY